MKGYPTLKYQSHHRKRTRLISASLVVGPCAIPNTSYGFSSVFIMHTLSRLILKRNKDTYIVSEVLSRQQGVIAIDRYRFVSSLNRHDVIELKFSPNLVRIGECLGPGPS